jgi:16S rRNA (cytosine1402-N4)-methyltransferase
MERRDEIVEHLPVMLDAVMNALSINPDGVYVDCTFGRGGHARAILERLGAAGRVLAFDRDPEAVDAGRELQSRDPRFEMIFGAFDSLADALTQRALTGQVNGILFDLGVSSPQLDDPRRGFSFQADGPLDMRMDPSQGESASQWLARAQAEEIADVLWRLGEERDSRRIARAIVRAREQDAITGTAQLAEIVRRNVRRPPRGRHPATKTFQAIRIYVNQELDLIDRVLPQALAGLALGGRLVVMSFHSLEDRIVKRFMREWAGLIRHRGIPGTEKPRMLDILVRKQRASEEEKALNPRARSAVLRVAAKIRMAEPGELG